MIPKLNRRHFVATASLALASCATQRNISKDSPHCADSDDWQAFESQLLDDIQAPKIPNREFLLADYNIQPGEDISLALKQCIEDCFEQGGGRIVVPQGAYITGPIHLRSHIELHLSENALLQFKTSPDAYLPEVFSRWEGMELMGFSPLIYAFEQSDIAITGKGTIDGRASIENWWPWKGNKEWGRPGFPSQDEIRNRLMSDVEKSIPVDQRRYGDENYLRPPLIQFYRCSRVHLENVTLLRSPFWLFNPVLCQDVVVRGVIFNSLGPNSDGCNPESCRNVLIEDCFFDTGDDCIAIKSGRNADGRRINIPSENILVRNCQMRAGHGGVVVGSEISGGARNIYVENCHMSSPDLERGLRIKTNSVRGGVIEKLRFRNIIIGEVGDAIVINFYYEEGDAGNHLPSVSDIKIENLLCLKSKRAFHIRGFPHRAISNMRLTNVHFMKSDGVGNTEHVEGLDLNNVSVNGKMLARHADKV